MHFGLLELKSFDTVSLLKYQTLIQNLGKACEPFVFINKPATLPKKNKKFVVIRSPFVHKKSQTHFGISNTKILFLLKSSNLECLILVLNYIQKNLSLNVECKIVKKIIFSNY